MAEQGTLDGFAPPVATDRLFFAVLPDPATAERIAQLGRDQRATHALRGKPLPAERLHITLFHLGDFTGLPAHIVGRAIEAAGHLRAAAFEIVLDTVGSFDTHRRDHPLVLRGPPAPTPLHIFRRRLGEHLLATGAITAIPGQFEPHVTLLYDPRLIAPQPVDAVSWTAHELVLVHSLLGQTRHLRVGRWTLAG